MSTYGGGNNNYQGMPPTTPSRDNSTPRTAGYGGTSPSPIVGDNTRGPRSPDFSPSPGSNVMVTKRVVEPDRSYLETLKKTIDDNMAEEARLRQEREQLMRENQMLQQQLASGNASPGGPINDSAYESNLQRNMMLKSEIADLQRRLDRERENQRKSLGFQEQRAREFEDRIRSIEMENNQLKQNLTTSNEKESQLRLLTSENQRLKDELFRTGDPQKLDTLKIIQENSQLKARISQLEKELALARQEKEQLERANAAQSLGKSDKLMKELRRLNEDNVTLYDDNKLLMRQNQMLKNEIDELRRGMGIPSQTGTPTRDPNAEMQIRKMQDSMNLLMQENRNLSSELAAIKSRMQGPPQGSSIEDQNTINRLRADLASRDRELAELRGRFPRLESDLRNLQSELKMVSQNAQENGEKVRQLTAILNQRDEEIRRLSQNQGSAQAANSQQLQQVIRSKDEEIANLSRSRFELENKVNNAENDARMQKANAESLRGQLNNALQSQNGASIEINNLRRRVKELEIERDESLRRGNPPDENLIKQKEFLEKELDRKLQREKRIETELTKLRNEVELLIEERDTFKKKYKEGDTAREALERENSDLRRRPTETSQQDVLINELRNRDMIISDQNAQIQSLRQQLKAPRGDPNTQRELENKINYLMSENSKLKFEMDNYQKMQESSFKTKYLIDDLNRKISALELEKERTDQRLRDKDAETRGLEEARRIEKTELDNTRATVRRLQDRVNQLDQERSVLVSRQQQSTGQPDPAADALRQENRLLNERLNAARDPKTA